MNDQHPQFAGTSEELEQALTAMAWKDAAATSNPETALASLGVDIPDGVRLDVRLQRRDTLYFVIPPADTDGGDTDHVLNQMDLWGSADQFVWVLPQDEKVALLNMREQYRRTVSERGR